MYGVPSVKLAWFADATPAGAVGRSVFWPVPNVDSALLALAPPRAAATRTRPTAGRCSRWSTRPSGSGASRCGPRWRGWAGSPSRAEQALRAAGIDPASRAERLTVDDFARLAAHRHVQ